jgi:hypothetical protein
MGAAQSAGKVSDERPAAQGESQECDKSLAGR